MLKKSLSMVLVIVMVLSCMTTIAIPTFATEEEPTGIGITSISEITDMNGDYYLIGDIGSKDAPNTGTLSGTFTGSLDGNHKTVYTTVPLFNALGTGAEVKNLTTDGALSTSGGSCGAIAATARGAFSLIKCTNNADITYTVNSSGVNVGGFVGSVTASGISMTDCTNNGDLIMPTKNTAGQARVGGLIGYNNASATNPVSTATYTNCVNYGMITDNSSFSLIGGLVGFYNGNENYVFNACQNFGAITGGEAGGKIGGLIGVSAQNRTHEYINCHNNAVITEQKNIVGGLVGQEGGTCTFRECTNKGEVKKRAQSAESGASIGGIVAYASNAVAHTYVDCVNEADLTGAFIVGGIVGDDRGALTIKECRNKGTITGPQGSTILAYMGGLVGQQNGAFPMFIENSGNEGTIEITTTNGTKLAGGIIGRSENATDRTFINCTNSGGISVNSGGKVGGLAGCIGNASTGTSTFIGCVNSGDIFSYIYAGGMVGNERGTIKFISCINNATMNIPATATANDTFAAGMVGIAPGSVTAYSCFNYGRLTNGRHSQNVADIAKTVLNAQYCESAEVDVMTLEFEGVQRSVPVENETSYSIRFIASVSNTWKYSSTGFLVYRATSGSSSAGLQTLETDTVYAKLIEVTEDGEKEIYPAEKGKYFSALAVTDIPVQGSYSFIVVPFMILRESGAVVYADACTTVVTDGEIRACYNLPAAADMDLADKNITLAGNDLSDYTIVYETERDGYAEIANQLRNSLLAMGYSLRVAADTALPYVNGAKEILVGNTNRSASQALYAVQPDLMTYSVVIGETYLQLVSGGPYSASVCADELCSKFIITSNKAFKSGELLKGDINLDNSDLATEADLRIMTANVLAARWATTYNNCPPVVQRAEIFAASLVSGRPDVIGVQESDNEWIKILPYYLAVIKEKYGMEYEWIFEDWKSDLQTFVSEGQTLTTMIYRSDKYTLEDSGIQNIDGWNKKEYNLRLLEWGLFSEKQNPAHRFIVCNTHWSLSTESAAWQAQSVQLSIDTIRSLQDKYSNVPIFQTGDYNSTNDQGSLYTKFLAESGAFDAMLTAAENGVRINDCGGCAGIGVWRGANSSYIDHIACVGSGIRVLRYETLIGKNIYCSDHLPQIADFDLW